jgi:hypothetical protein
VFDATLHWPLAWHSASWPKQKPPSECGQKLDQGGIEKVRPLQHGEVSSARNDADFGSRDGGGNRPRIGKGGDGIWRKRQAALFPFTLPMDRSPQFCFPTDPTWIKM